MPSNGNAAEDGGSHGALETLRSLLTADETLEAWAMEHRLFALTHRRVWGAPTSGRFISLNRRLLGGHDHADIPWQDLKETRIRPRLIGAHLSLRSPTRSELNHGTEGKPDSTFA